MSFKIINHIPRVVNKLSNIIVKNGKGCWVYDKSNRKILDMTAGIGALSTGHSHPNIVNAINNQSNNLIHAQQNCFLSHQPQIDLTKRLLEIMPNNLETFFYVNSGSEATDNSIKIARQFTGKQNIISIKGGFHGRTLGAMALTSSKLSYRSHCGPLMPGVFFCDKNESDFNYILSNLSSPEETAAVIVEPILGEGGIIPLEENFLKYIREECTKNNITLIIDEVQSGAGRAGKWWASDNIIKPDIMTFAKGIASGFPFAGLAIKNNIIDNIRPNLLGGTYGGNALGSAVALATINTIENENLIENANIQGKYLKQELLGFKNVKEVRQKGLMIGIDLEYNDDKRIKELLNKLIDDGILVLLTGNNSIRLLPPLIINKEEIDYFLSKFERNII